MARWVRTADGHAVDLGHVAVIYRRTTSEATGQGVSLVARLDTFSKDHEVVLARVADHASADVLLDELTSPNLERVRTQAHALIELAMSDEQPDDAEVARLVVEAVVAIVDGLRS